MNPHAPGRSRGRMKRQRCLLKAVAAQADPATLAGGIWEALLTTAMGMIPLLLDAFFISIEAEDPTYDRERTPRLLKDLGASHVEPVAA